MIIIVRLNKKEFGELVAQILSRRNKDFFDHYYEPDEPNGTFQDDGFVHVIRNGTSYAFDAPSEFQASESDEIRYTKATDYAIKIARNMIRRKDPELRRYIDID